jgi:2-methylisocitrate lyase-like PEP mutase family enzyme
VGGALTSRLAQCPLGRVHDLARRSLAVERVQAARQAIDESGTGIVLTGRSEGFVIGRPDIDETIRRLRACAEAGADCLYAPRIGTVEHIAAIIAAVSPKPVNLLINAPLMSVAEAAALGVTVLPPATHEGRSKGRGCRLRRK